MIPEITDMIKKIKTTDELKEVFNTLKESENGINSFSITYLLRKTGSIRNISLLQEILDYYQSVAGYDNSVINCAINQYSRLRRLDCVVSLYHSLMQSSQTLTKTTYERFLSSLLLYKEYERLCLNITKQMLRLNYSISREFLIQCLGYVGTRSSDMVIALLTITNPRELSTDNMKTILNDQILSFASANCKVSVWELYKYLCLLAPNMNKSHLTPYICESLCYFISR